jgi:hypothetical protein
MKILTPISLGELYDKISILEIKMKNIENPQKLVNITNEWEELKKVAVNYPISDELYFQLKEVNQKIWDIEDGIREEERNKDWGDDFIKFARGVYFNNDERSRIKKEINEKYGSEIIEEKSYAKY